MDKVDHFQKYFMIRECQTSEDKNRCYRLRYDIFVKEFHYEPDNEQGMEYDEFDEAAIHYLIEHRESKLIAGTIRFIETRLNLVPPTMKLFKHENDLDTFEVSRFSISSQFRKRFNENLSEVGHYEFSEDDLRSHPLIILGLISAIYKHCQNANYKSFYAIMEMKLIRLLHHFGIDWTSQLPPIEYHGTRIPCFVTFEQFSSGLKPEIREFMDKITIND